MNDIPEPYASAAREAGMVLPQDVARAQKEREFHLMCVRAIARFGTPGPTHTNFLLPQDEVL